MRNLYALFLLIVCCSFQGSIVIPSDFYFKIDSGGTDNYNSKTGLFRRLYIGGAKIFEIKLDDNDRKAIYELCKVINFQSFPENFEINSNTPDPVTITMPSFRSSIEVCGDSICKRVTLNFEDLKNPIHDKEKAFIYEKLYNKIWQIIESKEEYKNIPESDVFYF